MKAGRWRFMLALASGVWVRWRPWLLGSSKEFVFQKVSAILAYGAKCILGFRGTITFSFSSSELLSEVDVVE